jgi:hypothetical protein
MRREAQMLSEKSFLVYYKSNETPNGLSIIEQGDPPTDLKVGDEIDFDGIKWYVVEIKEFL